MQNSEDELKKEFLAAGKNFFSWNSGKNTPNILLMLTEQLGKLEGTIKESGETSSKLAGALNKITSIYVILTGVIAVATALQVWLAFLPKESVQIDSATVSNLVDKRLTEREAHLVAALSPKMQAIYSDMLQEYSPPQSTPTTLMELFVPALEIVSGMSSVTEQPAQNPSTEQPGTGQPATRPVVESEGGEQPQPQAEGRSR